VRIVAQLIDADTERQLWAETYDRQLTDIFQIQSDVALQIAGALRAELSRDEQRRVQAQPTRDVRAYQLVLRARQWFTQYTEAAVLQAIACYEEALALDPQYAQAWAGLARTYCEAMTVQIVSFADVAITKAREAATRALTLDPGLAEAHEVMGLVRMIYDYDWEGAEGLVQAGAAAQPERCRRAVPLRPGSAGRWSGTTRRSSSCVAHASSTRWRIVPTWRRRCCARVATLKPQRWLASRSTSIRNSRVDTPDLAGRCCCRATCDGGIVELDERSR
jgi:tetratricopeptide (TPR) repeat protein